MDENSPLEDILPHGPSMVFLDEILSHDEERTHCRVLPETHPHTADRPSIPPWIGFEYLGQTACVHTVLEGATAGSEGGMGVLIGVRELKVHVPRLEPGTPLRAEVRLLLHQGSLQSSRGRLVSETDERVLIEGRLNAYLSEDPGAFRSGDRS